MAQKSAKPRRQDTAWRVDDISPEAAATAEQAAASEGVALSAWLSRLIRDTAARERAERNQERAAAGPDEARHRAPPE